MSEFSDVAEFIYVVRGKEFPRKHHAIKDGIKLDRTNFMQEELNEFWEAETLEDQVDALIDLQYFLLGTFYEMGVTEEQYKQCWQRVNEANMTKEKGKKDGRETSTNDDAAKPNGWAAPDFSDVFGED